MSTATDRCEARRKTVERLKKEGRPAGRPGCGYRHVGPRGRRRRVVDERQLKQMKLVARWRDDEQMSWNQISDALETHIAGQEGRRPRSPGFRRGTDKKRCWRLYHRLKEIESATPPTNRRCKGCQRSRRIEMFSDEGDTCDECAITGPLRRKEIRRSNGVFASLLALGRAVERQRPPEELKALFNAVLVQGNGPTLAASDIVLGIETLARTLPGEKRTLDAIIAFARLPLAVHMIGPEEIAVAAMSDFQIEQELKRQLRPAILELQGEQALRRNEE